MSEERPKHTPGTMKVYLGGNFVHIGTSEYEKNVQAGGNLNKAAGKIGEVNLQYPFNVTEEDIAIGHLWSASPDMYEALKARIQADAHPSTCNLCQPSNPCRQYYIESGNANLKMYKALAKAEGKTNV